MELYFIQQDLRIDGILYVKIAKHGEIIKQSSISLHFEKHKGQRVDYKRLANADPSRSIKQKYKADTNGNIFLRAE